mmetsp:Transcript_12298/g.20724  ORF Transcript_12298/g.20724 Transcript_12298/m.20724 type:complete len:524 (+) Transcript_12298:33-1604(+)
MTRWGDFSWCESQRWGQIGCDSARDEIANFIGEGATGTFPIDSSLNNKIIITQGSIAEVEVDCIVIDNNEILSDRSGTTGEVFIAAGTHFERAVKKLGGCRTGESIMTSGFGLPARQVVHAIGPRYHPKHAIAAESALFRCYRSALSLCKKHSLRRVALSILHIESRKNYPCEAGAHTALRCLRCYLQHHSTAFDLVLLVLPTVANLRVYQYVAPLYFPRNASELARSATELPHDLGDEFGERVLPERKIRISIDPACTFSAQYIRDGGVHARPRELSDEFQAVLPPPAELRAAQQLVGNTKGAGSFANASSSQKAWVSADDSDDVYLYTRLLLCAQATERSTFEANKIAFVLEAKDMQGRPTLALIGSRFHACCPTPQLQDQALLYLIRITETIVRTDFTIVFVAAGMPQDCGPTLDFLRDTFEVMPASLQARLAVFHLLQPPLSMRLAFLLLGVRLWGRLNFVDHPESLHKSFSPAAVDELLAEVRSHEQAIYAAPAATADSQTLLDARSHCSRGTDFETV